MAYELKLSALWKAQGWKVKIRDKERAEPPHVTIMRGTRAWRINLRTRQFMDSEPDPNELPKAIVSEVMGQMQTLAAKWDEMYPHNPVFSEADNE